MRGAASCRSSTVHRKFFRRSKADFELSPFLAGRHEGQFAAMKPHEFPGEIQSDPMAGDLVAIRAPGKPLKNEGLHFGGNRRPAIADSQIGPAIFLAGGDMDASAGV